MLEVGVDFIVASTFNGMGGHPKHPEVPRSLDRKIDYLRKFAKLPVAAEWAARMESICDGLQRLKEQRHIIVHGMATAELEGGGWSVFKVRYEKLIHASGDHPVTEESILQLTGETAELTESALGLASELLARIQKAPNDPGGWLRAGSSIEHPAV
jgi:hypothetical protein